jgi:hypothetical protein
MKILISYILFIMTLPIFSQYAAKIGVDTFYCRINGNNYYANIASSEVTSDTVDITWNVQQNIAWNSSEEYWYSTGGVLLAYGVADQYIADGDSGWVSFYESSRTYGNLVIVALDATSTNTDYTSYDYGVYFEDDNPWEFDYVVDGSNTASGIGSPSPTYQRLRVSSSGNLYAEYSEDESTWYEIHDFGSVSGDLYIKMNFYDNTRRAYDLKCFGTTEQ